MALSTFAELKTAIADQLSRDDLSAHIPDFITIAEARMRRDIRIRDMIKRSTATIAGRYLALPGDFLEAHHLRVLTNPVTVLTEINLHEMSRQRRETTGKPRFFTVHEEIEFDVTPDSTYTAEIIYYAQLTALSDGNTFNAILTKAPDVYLYGSLVASAPFLHEDERLQTWATLYVAATEGLVQADRKSRNVGPIVARVVGGAP